MALGVEASQHSWSECRVELPAPESWLVLDLAVDQPMPWARATAEDHVGADASADRRDAFADEVLWYWGAAIRQRAICAALLAPADGPVLASYSVREVAVSQELLRLEALRRDVELAEGPFFGSPSISEVDLPVGSAVRVHRMEPSAPESAEGEVIEGVAHYVLPRPYPVVLEARLLWSSIGLGEELATVADALAESIKLV
ncbi:hypothetical protein AB0M19_27205 [Streptomyces sp. NPDC051920]|uniref:hypothetical protein n=1 Tax=Streptomyces sp. NPDC051920 TaxID=3155523 RepID=UPI003435FEFF